MDSDILVGSFVPPLQYGKHRGEMVDWQYWQYADRLIEITMSQNGSVGEDLKARLLCWFSGMLMRGKGFWPMAMALILRKSFPQIDRRGWQVVYPPDHQPLGRKSIWSGILCTCRYAKEIRWATPEYLLESTLSSVVCFGIRCVFWYRHAYIAAEIMASPMPRFLPAIVSRAAAIALGCWCILRCFWNRMLTGHGVKWLAPGLKWRSWRRVKVRRLEPIRICVEDWVPKNNRGFSGLSWSIGAMAYFRLVLGIIKQPWIRYLGERHRMVVSWWSQWFFHILFILFHPWQFSGTRWFLLIPISLLKHHDSKKKPSWPPTKIALFRSAWVPMAPLPITRKWHRELSSAVRYEVMEQLFPDWNKAAERTRDAEISPSLKDPLVVGLSGAIQSDFKSWVD